MYVDGFTGRCVLALVVSRAKHQTAASALLPCLLVLGKTVPLEEKSCCFFFSGNGESSCTRLSQTSDHV
ncbi:hypothetical protein PFLUV_G00157040 [Perca fluviatilis]|uniref:Uncharacterized protein n=1 Tax=Perca fluviatilis TaxID=8168 RepID=A0A6A5EL89_PERFL|nr:hypothetical protein PFLUV_G00157040 [Perca fluviatilis]